jgi:hypothetical protein
MPESKSKTVLLLKPRGLCAGVVRAIDIVRIALETFGPPIYVRKEIVHNRFVVEELSAKGAIFVDEVDEVPDGQRVIYSAHGVAPEVREASERRKLRVIDATSDRMGRRMKLVKNSATIPLPIDYPIKDMDDWMKYKHFFEYHNDRINWGQVETAKQLQLMETIYRVSLGLKGEEHQYV